jgi:hypothetical protein
MGPNPVMTNLLTLVEEERLDELLDSVNMQDIAKSWCAHSLSQGTGGGDEDDANWWAAQLWMTPTWWRNKPLVRKGLLALIQCAPSDDVLAHVAAGPLETFISGNEEDLAWLEEQARRSSKFRRALGQVWIWDLPDWVVRRVERAAKTSLPMPADGKQPRDAHGEDHAEGG